MMRKHRRATLLGLILTGLAATAGPAAAVSPSGLAVTARIAGPDGGWDYASFDPARGRVYIAHGMSVLSIDAATGKMNPAFAAGDHLHAVIPVPASHLIVTTNSGDNTARVIDAADGRQIAAIPTAKDPDGAVYDPSTGWVLVMDGDSGEVTLVDPKAATSPGSITIGGSLEFPAVDGKGRLFVNVEDHNEIAVVDIAGRKVVARYPLAGCRRPTGLAYVAGDRLISACGNGVAKIVAAADGRELASFTIGGFPDAVIYDPRRALAYVPSALSGTLAVIALRGAGDNHIVDTVTTQTGARTGAVDPVSGRIYLPTAQFVLPAPAGHRPAPKPGTFEVLVLDRR